MRELVGGPDCEPDYVVSALVDMHHRGIDFNDHELQSFRGHPLVSRLIKRIRSLHET